MSVDHNHWLGMGTALTPLSPAASSLFCCKENEQQKSPIVVLLERGPIFTVLELFLVECIQQRGQDKLILHPFLSECLLHIASTTSNDITDADECKGCPFQIVMPTTTMSPNIINCPKGDDTNTFYASRIEAVRYPHPKFYNSTTIFSSSTLSNNNNIHSYYQSPLSISLRCDFQQIINLHPILKSPKKDEERLQTILIQHLKQALVHRLVIRGMIILLPIPFSSCLHMIINNEDISSHDEILHAIVDNVISSESEERDELQCYRIGPVESFHLSLIVDKEEINTLTATSEEERLQILRENETVFTCCPGYTMLMNELIQLATLWNRRASSPVLLTGCSGVGKTRMASAFIDSLSHLELPYVLRTHRVSVRELLALSTSAIVDTASELFNHLLPPSLLLEFQDNSRPCWLVLIIDDIDLLVQSFSAYNDSDDGGDLHSEVNVNQEQAFIVFTISKAIEQLLVPEENFRSSPATPPPFILGLSRLPMSRLPKDLCRIGRFEKEIFMPPPNQSQREEIFQFWLNQLPIQDSSTTNRVHTNTTTTIKRWTSALSPQLAGCVASDIRRICADALLTATTRFLGCDCNSPTFYDSAVSFTTTSEVSWSDIRDAARQCIPSQLEALDVTSPRVFLDCDDEDIRITDESKADISKERYKKCWKYFGGYSEVKDKVYRTVVGPWLRFMQHQSSIDERCMGIAPPSGVLFHGPSGVGKTFAAECLASSLGLNSIKIRASDILNKWLGGSEAAIRSIFSRARSAAPCVLFFDDLDALATNREQDDDSVHSRMLSTFLNEMDGISTTKSEILVICATDRLDSIDAALLRPGRLDEHIHLQMPTAEDCEEILQLHTKKLPLSADMNLEYVGKILFDTGVATGAKIEGLCREACLNAFRKNLDSENVEVTLDDFLSIIESF